MIYFTVATFANYSGIGRLVSEGGYTDRTIDHGDALHIKPATIRMNLEISDLRGNRQVNPH